MPDQMNLPIVPPARFCNRCNQEKHDNDPCPNCGSPEFRVVAPAPC